MSGNSLIDHPPASFIDHLLSQSYLDLESQAKAFILWTSTAVFVLLEESSFYYSL